MAAKPFEEPESDSLVHHCLPPELRGASPVITKIAEGLSGAGVYRIDSAGRSFVLKIDAQDVLPAVWRRKLEIQQLAANAGIAPPIVHADESRHAVVSVRVTGQPFQAYYYRDPRTRETALLQLGRTLRRVHELPIPPGASAIDARAALAAQWSGPLAGFPVPRFVENAIQFALSEEPPPRERGDVLSHNDVNPTNLLVDGETLFLVDWQAAGANEPFHDLATISLFLRMDEQTCLRLLAAYDDAPVSRLPVRFIYVRRNVALFCGATFLRIARQSGHAGATGTETVESTLSLGEFYQQLQAGSLGLATAEGQWAFGLALIKESGVA
jgi:aminoglycoside phosphotransferase (APT) family kinase protein